MNQVNFVGRLTKEVEMRYAANNTAVAGFTLAVNRRFKRDGEPEADFFPIVAWEKKAEFCGKYFKKGQQIWLTGRLQTRTYDDKEGKKVYVTEIVAEEVGFADSKREDGNATAPAQQQPAAQQAQPNANAPWSQPQSAASPSDKPPWA